MAAWQHLIIYQFAVNMQYFKKDMKQILVGASWQILLISNTVDIKLYLLPGPLGWGMEPYP